MLSALPYLSVEPWPMEVEADVNNCKLPVERSALKPTEILSRKIQYHCIS